MKSKNFLLKSPVNISACAKYFCIVGLLLCSVLSFAQNKTQLEREKVQLTKELEEANKLLLEVRNSKESSMVEVNMIDKKLKTRERLIRNIAQQQNILASTIALTETDITNLEEDIQFQKDEYARMIRYAYKTRDAFDLLAFLFAADSFNDAINRFQYIRHYNEYRKRKATTITESKNELSNYVLNLNDQMAEQAQLLSRSEVEKGTLDQERKKKASIVSGLKEKEDDLKYKVEVKKVAIEQLNATISRIVKTALKSETGTNYALSPAAVELSSRFSKNKAKLPWPVDRGVITSTFGVNKHPIYDIQIENNGIDISTSAGTSVKAVFSGTVSSIVFSPSFQNAVIVNHGEYFTTYSNLKDVVVVDGQKVSTGQILGTIHTDAKEGRTELHFELWKGISKQNPQKWILRR